METSAPVRPSCRRSTGRDAAFADGEAAREIKLAMAPPKRVLRMKSRRELPAFMLQDGFGLILRQRRACKKAGWEKDRRRFTTVSLKAFRSFVAGGLRRGANPHGFTAMKMRQPSSGLRSLAKLDADAPTRDVRHKFISAFIRASKPSTTCCAPGYCSWKSATPEGRPSRTRFTFAVFSPASL